MRAVLGGTVGDRGGRSGGRGRLRRCVCHDRLRIGHVRLDAGDGRYRHGLPGLVLRIQTGSRADQTGIIVQRDLVALIIIDGIGIRTARSDRTAHERTDEGVRVAGLGIVIAPSAVAGGRAMMRILRRIIAQTDDEAGVGRILTEQIAHLPCAPCTIVRGGIFAGRECRELHGSVVARTAPFTTEIVPGSVADAGEIIVQIRPIPGDVRIDGRGTGADIVPREAPADVVLLVPAVGLVLLLLGCQIEPSGGPCLVILIAPGIVEAGASGRGDLIMCRGIGIERLGIGQVLCVAEVEVVQGEGRSVLGGDVARPSIL